MPSQIRIMSLSERQARLAAEQAAINAEILPLAEKVVTALAALDLSDIVNAAAALPDGDALKEMVSHVSSILDQARLSADMTVAQLSRTAT